MTQQELFDKIATHLLAQNKKSEADEAIDLEDALFSCLYRGPNGTKCAVGCIIPDDEYQESWEGMSVSWIIDSRLSPTLMQYKEHLSMLSYLQSIHDNYKPDVWRKVLKEAATFWKLDWNHGD